MTSPATGRLIAIGISFLMFFVITGAYTIQRVLVNIFYPDEEAEADPSK